ncbi:MAG: methyltransferase domain-containing protein [Candidatus Methanoperedens sp.]
MKQESNAMHFFKKLGMEGIAWSLRRLHCPVGKDALVLEIGAGGNPYPRANILLDAYEETVERIESSLVKDRPLVLGFAEKLPFKNKSFDFIIASHILEHSPYPEHFLKELMRVGKAGYIETPDAFFERINPFTYHRLEVAGIGSKIRIFKKPFWRHDREIVDEYERKLKDRKFIGFISKHPEPFYMRFYWQDSIDFEIVNPEVDSNWQLPDEAHIKSKSFGRLGMKMPIRGLVLRLVRILFSQNNRNKKIDLFRLMACPTCGSDMLLRYSDSILCNNCRTAYPLKNGIPVMYPQTERMK